jgi:hypothetical protein
LASPDAKAVRRERYELCLLPESCKRGSKDGPRFRFSRCKDIMPEDSMVDAGTPLPSNLVQPLFPSVPWENFKARDPAHCALATASSATGVMAAQSCASTCSKMHYMFVLSYSDSNVAACTHHAVCLQVLICTQLIAAACTLPCSRLHRQCFLNSWCLAVGRGLVGNGGGWR